LPNDLMTHDLGTLLALHESDISRQVQTARMFPRSEDKAEQRITRYATMNEDVAAECNYCVPRSGKPIQGPSVRLAEIVGSCWGNASYASRIIDESEAFVTAQAVFMDYEHNIRVQVEVQRQIVNSKGERYTTDMIGTTSQAAMSIAMRNAIFKGVPRAIWGEAYAKARALVAGTIESLDKRRGAALDAFKKLGATDAMVLQLLGKEGIRDIEPDDLVTLRGVLTSIKDGDATYRSIFGNMEMDGGKAARKADVRGAVERGRNAANGQAANGGEASKGPASPKEEAKPQEGGGKPEVEPKPDGRGTPAEVDAGGGEKDASADDGDGFPGDAASSTPPKEPQGAIAEPAPAVASPKLDEEAANHLEREHGEPWDALLAKLVDEIRKIPTVRALNSFWDSMSPEFAAAPDEVDQAQQALRSARRRDITAASNASRTAAASKL